LTWLVRERDSIYCVTTAPDELHLSLHLQDTRYLGLCFWHYCAWEHFVLKYCRLTYICGYVFAQSFHLRHAIHPSFITPKQQNIKAY